ncbi:MAG TPA: NUDIX domain-containing protein [Motilibacteraceae bacterium]|nr:NUDIX domain-containing protein [Motilibacteraceae bacterium]
MGLPGGLPPDPHAAGPGAAGRAVVACVGAVVHDDDGRLLLVRRANEPARGRWSLPGGRVEAGEDDAAAVRREVLEETGLDVVVGAWVGTVQRDAPDGRIYDIRDYACALMGGRLRAGDDASAARFVDRAGLHELAAGDGLSEGLLECLSAWGVLPHR